MALSQNPNEANDHSSGANSGKIRIYQVAFFPIENKNNFIASHEENIYSYKLDMLS